LSKDYGEVEQPIAQGSDFRKTPTANCFHMKILTCDEVRHAEREHSCPRLLIEL
jgi:hypothetical protein